ncbi:UvrD-helicase domain-containing protein [Aestuariivirga sp.]|uniref:UvrD-helicase domain-containing protein n=1 Tax=Aestuariivirga sp. TaxID=2650926 RepID=UPI0039E421A1
MLTYYYSSPKIFVFFEGKTIFGMATGIFDYSAVSNSAEPHAGVQTYRPVWLFRIFGLAPWELEIGRSGIHAGLHKWSYETLRQCDVTEHWLWNTVSLGPSPTVTLRGVPKHAAGLIYAAVLLAKPIHAAHRLIEELLSCDRYVSERERQCLVEELSTHVYWREDDPYALQLKHIPSLEQQYRRILRFIDGDRQELDERNKRFVEAELHAWCGWFDRVEKTPLTDEQARACIVMEDRNLLVAAAGSGKTSTIVAKAAYAIGKQYCRPDQMLLLTFNRSISTEIKERLNARASALGLPADVTVATFHSFGYGQVKQLDRSARLASWAGADAKAIEHLKHLASRLRAGDSSFSLALAEFSAIWAESDQAQDNHILAAAASKSLEEAMRKLVARQVSRDAVPLYTTLAGVTVRSLQELRICNWLTLMGVDFEYERAFPSQHVPNDWKSGYRPDFYYPAIDCWHEHFGLNKLGKAPPWMSAKAGSRQRTYEEEVANKRAVLAKSGADWFETTSADFDEGTWEAKLHGELKTRGMEPAFIGWDRLAQQYQQLDKVSGDVIRLVLTCIGHAKSNRLSPDDVENMLASIGNGRAKAFLKVFLPLYRAYEDDLREHRQLDYEDMVMMATDAFLEGSLTHPYKLILVDEFQDVSNSRAALIAAMLAQSPEARLFGVGDDWQSIYRFAGADITAMTHFGERFGFTATNWLSRTFRSNQAITDAASQFVMKNPAQLRKTVKARTQGTSDSIEVIFHADDGMEFLARELEALAEYAREKNQKLSVFLLGRYNFLKPTAMDGWSHRFSEFLELSYMTIHKSKGLEADIVFLIGATDKKGRDFPSTVQDDPLLGLFMPEPDAMPWAEERRLFYVVLTRARSKVYIMAAEGHVSPFVAELLASKDVSCSSFSGGQKTEVKDPAAHLRSRLCPRCEKGTVERRVSKYGPFEVCEKSCGYKRNLPRPT